MRIIIASIVALNFVACSHTPEQAPAPQAPQYAFKVVSETRKINSEDKKKGNKAKNEKFVEVSNCAPGQPCEGSAKMIPYEQFTAKLNAAALKQKDLVDRQQGQLAKGLQQMKFERTKMVEEKAFYEQNMKTHKWASVKPVMDGYKRGHVAVNEDIKHFDAKIHKMEKGLEYLKNVKGIQLGMDESTQKLMEMVETGHWNMDCGHEHDMLTQFFQNLGREIASN